MNSAYHSAAIDPRGYRFLSFCTALVVVLFQNVSQAQLAQLAENSGVPGDGIVDVYYFPTAGSVRTSSGLIHRPAGTLTVDTDGTDMVAILIAGPNASGDNYCDLCDNDFMYDPNAVGQPLSSWVVGYSGGSTQWIRTSPLQSVGFQGVMGEFDGTDLPEHGLANYGPGLGTEDFPAFRYDFSQDGTWGVLYGMDSGVVMLTNVTIVPEPVGAAWLTLGALALVSWRYRRRGPLPL